MEKIPNDAWEKIFLLRDEFFIETLEINPYDYQKEISNMIIKSAFNDDGDTYLLEQCRQSGKSTIVTMSIVFILLFYYQIKRKFGIWEPKEYNIGIFAPQQEQAKTDFTKLKLFLRLVKQKCGNLDFEIAENNGNTLVLRSKDYPQRTVYCFSASPTSNTESKTLHFIIYEEAHMMLDSKIDNTISPMGAQCVCKDTLVLNKNGEHIPIQDVSTDDSIIGYDIKNFKIIENKVGKNGTSIKKCVELKTNSKRVLKCSRDHPVLIKKRIGRKLEWKLAGEVIVGEQVAINDTLDIFGEEKMFDPRLIGMLIGDGSYRKRGMVRFCSNDKELIKYVEKYDFKSYNNRITKDGRLFQDGTLKGGVLKELRKLGIYGQTGKNKRLPNNIDNYTKKDICNLIGGLIDTDGCVIVEEKSRRGKIYFFSSNITLIQQVFLLLEKLGIHSRIVKEIKDTEYKKNFTMYKLEIAAKISIERFIDNVKLLTERKQKRLERLKDIYKNKGSKRCKNMPNIYFERIIQNKDIGEQKVYGINALHNHTFLANNFITHNTNASSVYIGTAWYQKSRYYQMLTTLPDTHKVIVPYQRALEERKKKYDETLDPIHLNYAKHIRKEIAKLGEDGDAFKTQYALKWILERGQFITEEVLLVLENTEKEDPPLFVGRGEVCYAGIDWGKSNDSTVMTVVNDKHQIIYWLEFNGDDYYSQILAIMEVIKAKFHGMKAIYCDSTGSQDQAVDNLRGRLRENGLYINTIPVTFTQASKDMMYRNLFSLMHDKKMGAIVMETAKLRYPKRQCVEKEKFISQFLILQKEVKNGFWKCHHPDGDYHDDYPDSLALACLAYGGLTKQYSPVVG